MSRNLLTARRPDRTGERPPAPPRVTGAEAQRDWVKRHMDAFRAAYRAAVRAGWPAGTVVVATPATERLDDPPAGFALCGPADARRLLARGLPSARVALDAAPPGMFYVVATCEGGRFRGTFVGLLQSPGPDEPLPPMAALPPPGRRPDRN